MITKHFVRVDGRLVHYRKAGNGPAVVLLHDSPRSSRLHLDTMTALMDQFTIHALDTPGYGNSEPLTTPQPSIAELAVALGRTLAELGLERAPLYATHTSSKIALDHAANGAVPPSLLILDGLAIASGPPDEEFIARYMRPLELDTSGAYLAAEWTRIRDGFRWFPWFETQPEFRLPTPVPTPEWIADFTLDLFSTGPFYPHAYAGAMRYDARPALRTVASPVIVAAKSDDVLYPALDQLPPDRSTTVRVERLSADRGEWLAWLRATLAQGAAAAGEGSLPAATSGDGPAYVDLAHGQMLIHRRGEPAPGARPLLILEAPTTLHARLWQDAVSPARATIVPELPGYGESDPLDGGSLDDHARALADMLAAIGVERVDVLGIAFAAPLVLALVRHHPALVGGIAFDGTATGIATTAETFASLCPAVAFDPAGGHLHRVWHMLRDGEAHWPWFDQRVEAMRFIPPDTAPEGLHRTLVDILKQPDRYGDAALAGVRAGPIDPAGIDAQMLFFDRVGDPASRGVTDLAARASHAQVMARPADVAEAAARLADFLDQPA